MMRIFKDGPVEIQDVCARLPTCRFEAKVPGHVSDFGIIPFMEARDFLIEISALGEIGPAPIIIGYTLKTGLQISPPWAVMTIIKGASFENQDFGMVAGLTFIPY
jgi:hypothetical protein